jgi:hypothetical protein
MTAPPPPLGERLPRPDVDTSRPHPDLEALREECDSLRAQLGDLQQRFEKLSRRVRHWEDQAPPPAGPPSPQPADGGADAPAPAPGGEEPPALRDLIDAMIRGADGPAAGSSKRRKALAAPMEGKFRRRCARLLRRPRLLGFAGLGLLLLLAVALALRFVF